MPLPPHPSLHLSLPLSDSDGDELRRVAEEDDDEDELIVLDPEHPLMKRFQTAQKNHQKSNRRDSTWSCERRWLFRCLIARRQRRQAQDQLEGVRSQYRTSQAGKQRSHVSQLQSEVANLALRLFYMQEVNTDLHSDITAMKNASRKAHSEKTQAEKQKHKQDLYVERLTKNMERLTEQLCMKSRPSPSLRRPRQPRRPSLRVHHCPLRAQMEMDSLEMGRKQLLPQWNSILVGMRRRDDAYTAMLEALCTATHQVRSLDTEIEGFKKSITWEEERNEPLTVLLNRTQLDSATSRKLISHSQQEALQAQYSIYTRTLQETEQTLQRVNTECAVHQMEVSSLRKQTEKEWERRIELEVGIMSKMQEHLTHDKATKYSRRRTDRTAAHKREKVSIGRPELLSASEARINKRVTVIDCKQATINVYNKKIEQLIASTGHEDLGLLEIQANTLTKQLEGVGGEIKEQQQLWLRQQGELVRLTQEKQARSTALLTLQTQFTILQQRKVRTECTEAERDSNEMQMKLERIQEEKDRLFNSLVESESNMVGVLVAQAEECDGVLRELQQDQASLSSSLRDKQLQLGELHRAKIVLTSDFYCLQDTKERNLAHLVSFQGRAKQLQAVHEGRYSDPVHRRSFVACAAGGASARCGHHPAPCPAGVPPAPRGATTPLPSPGRALADTAWSGDPLTIT
ncbi:coiled-coil domain-containing protein 40 [Salmo salar]|uniref:Coiled-coil domain-containing protein 40 n=1 Tax=Salmo salar TaxID=8030 RepID=A0ABM3CNF6_SALSA|nr:coiled-coil domain-containing protein 40-like [Salmo salar]